MKKILLSSMITCSAAVLAAPQVVTSIKPIYSLTAQVMDGIGEPILLVQQGSPHGYQLKPSDAKAVSGADLVIFASDELETYLPAVLEKTKVPHVIEWEKIPTVNPLLTRHGGMWAEGEDDHDHEHEGHDHDHEHEGHDHKHEGHGHDHKHEGHEHDHKHEGHEHDHKHEGHEHDHKHEGHDHHHGEHEHEHHHGKYDAHLWLDTARSQILLTQIAQELAEIDPKNAAKYQANAKAAIQNLTNLQSELGKILEPVKKRPYLVFHDAYQYFEQENGLNAIGTVRVDPEHEPGAKRVGELHDMMQKNEIVCVFSEPQFPAKIVDKLITGTTVKKATLDPVGAELPADKTTHEKLLRNLAENLVECLKP